jgi:hypothetical protein
MDAKLTLKLNHEVITQAKIYAESQKISLSRLIENYLNLLIKERLTQPEISPLVESLSGVIELPAKSDEKKEYIDFLARKYKME